VNQTKNQRDRVQEQVVAAKEGMKGYEEFKKEASQRARKCAEDDENLCRMEDDLSAEERKLSMEKNRLRDEERNISEVMKTRLRILGNLRMNMADEAWRWYEGNRDKFRYPVFVPVLHMTVPDARSAMLLENLIAFRDLPMFIFVFASLYPFRIEDLLANRPDIDQAVADLGKAKITAAREVYKVTLKMLCKLEKLRLASIRECFLRVTLKQLRDEGTKFEKDLQNLEEKLQDYRVCFVGSLPRRIYDHHYKFQSSLQSHVESFLCVKDDFVGLTECLRDKCGLKTLNLEQMTSEEKEILGCLEKV
ncbi:hypothetical protein Angca_001701, partial [Angiostrongylus cantonensis]